MTPLTALLLCLPAALAVIACGCCVAVLGPRPHEFPITQRSAGRAVGGAQHEAQREGTR